MANVISSVKMFYGAGELVGQNGTAYNGNITDVDGAVIDEDDDPGYLSVKSEHVFAVYCEEDGSLTFYNNSDNVPSTGSTYSGKTVTDVYTEFDTKVYSSASDVPWYSIRTSITSVVVEDAISPASTAYWFQGFTKCTEMDLLSLDTSSVTNMSYMFQSCSGLTELDLSGFDTSSAKRMACMFCDCYSLTTIYASDTWTADAVTNSSYMFYRDTCLVGGNGTQCSGGPEADATYACIDTDETPGYFTEKSVFAIIGTTSTATSGTIGVSLRFYNRGTNLKRNAF